MQTCNGCGRSDVRFNKNRAKPNGLNPKCAGCQKEYQNRWYQKYKERHKSNVKVRRERVRKGLHDKILQYLLTHPCVDCGEADPVVLEFDHVRGEKELNIAKAVDREWSWAQIEKEIGKCDVRCANCHRRRTAKQQGWKVRGAA